MSAAYWELLGISRSITHFEGGPFNSEEGIENIAARWHYRN